MRIRQRTKRQWVRPRRSGGDAQENLRDLLGTTVSSQHRTGRQEAPGRLGLGEIISGATRVSGGHEYRRPP